MKPIAAIAVWMLAVSSAAAQDAKYYTIDPSSVKFTRVGPSVELEEIQPPPNPGGGDNFDFSQVINIAQKLWKIIEDNKPVVDVKSQYATALPEGTKSWGQLDSWRPPVGTIYGFFAKNAYGMTVIDVRYQVLRTYGGGVKGKGRYLTAVTVQPLKVDVLWGYKFSMSAEVPDSSIVNVGSADNPVAAMTATLKWRVSTPIKDLQGEGVYYMQGDGLFKELGGPFSTTQAEKVGKLLQAVPKLPEFAVPAR